MARTSITLLLLAGCAHVSAGNRNAEWEQAKAQIAPCWKLLTQHLHAEGQACAQALARGTAPMVVHLAEDTQVTAFVLEGDFDRAQQVVDARSARSLAAKELEAVTWDLNMTTWLRWSRGDLEGALAANTRIRELVDGGGLDADSKRQVLLHHWWDRAYLLTELDRRADAEAARTVYRALARQPDEHDGLLVLDAFFAFKAKDFAAARAAALQVDAANDGDAQDLYVLWLALRAAGETAKADALFATLEGFSPYPMHAMVMRAARAEPRGSAP